MATFYGYLHSPVSWDENIAAGKLDKIPDVFERTTHRLPEIDGWKQYEYRSVRPITPDDIRRSKEPDFVGGPYPYAFYIRFNPVTNNMLIASHLFIITTQIIRTLNHHVSPNLSRFHINVQKVMEFLISPKDYLSEAMIPSRNKDVLQNVAERKTFFASRLQMDIHKYGTKLESITIHGRDVAGTDFLDDFEPDDLTARSIGIRHMDDPSETVYLQSAGGIQFYDDRSENLEKCLGLINYLGAFESTS